MPYFLAVNSPETIDLGFVKLGWFKVLILGIVQGITELLPISSTAHMRIVPSLLGWQDPGTAFSAAMQMASLGAVLSYFWKDIKNLSSMRLCLIIKPSLRLCLSNKYQLLKWVVSHFIVNKL